MSTQDAGTRQDLIENGVDRELLSIQKNAPGPQDLRSALQSEVEHDLIVWPREYLETYLDTGRDGIIPLNEVQLQDLLEAAFDRDEELALNAITRLKQAMTRKTDTTLTVSMDDAPSDRSASPLMVTGVPAIDGKDSQFLVCIRNDPDGKKLRELLEKTTAVAEERAFREALSAPGATHSYAAQWSIESRTSDQPAFVDIASRPTAANEPAPILRRLGVFDALKTRLRRLLDAGRRADRNSGQVSLRINPEFRKEDSRYVAQYEAGGATVRLHDKRSVEDERVVEPGFEERSVDGGGRLEIATEKDLQRKMDKDQSSATTAISQLSDSLQAAAGRAELMRQQRQVALTDSGIYSGKIISETPEVVIQRISAATEIAHPKSLFTQIPQIGQLVRIAYHNNIASVRELQERKMEKELSR